MTLFEHITNIYSTKIKFDDMDEESKKSYNVYMINRFLSMNINLLWLINLIQLYPLPTNIHQKLLVNIIPKQKRYDKYIKSTPLAKSDIIDYITSYYEVSRREAYEYVAILEKTNEGKMELKTILNSYGVEHD